MRARPTRLEAFSSDQVRVTAGPEDAQERWEGSVFSCFGTRVLVAGEEARQKANHEEGLASCPLLVLDHFAPARQ